jgi:hypothetical protein
VCDRAGFADGKLNLVEPAVLPAPAGGSGAAAAAAAAAAIAGGGSGGAAEADEDRKLVLVPFHAVSFCMTSVSAATLRSQRVCPCG